MKGKKVLPLERKEHEEYSKLRSKGFTNKEAYMQVYPDAKEKTAENGSLRLDKRPEIEERIVFLKNDVASQVDWSVFKSAEALKNIIKDSQSTDGNKIKATVELDKLLDLNPEDKKGGSNTQNPIQINIDLSGGGTVDGNQLQS